MTDFGRYGVMEIDILLIPLEQYFSLMQPIKTFPTGPWNEKLLWKI